MKTSLEISSEYIIPHSRVITLIEELSTLSEFQGISEQYDHIISHNKRIVKAWRMDERFYSAVVLFLPMNKRIKFTAGLINRLFEAVPTDLPITDDSVTVPTDLPITDDINQLLTRALTQAESVTKLSKLTGLNQGLISQWKNKKAPISKKGIVALKAYLGIDQ